MRIYVIGPITGFDDLNLPAFEAARDALRASGYIVLIPHDFIPADATWQQAMRRSLETLAKADGVACLPGWSKSNGARVEVETAQSIGIPVMSAGDWLHPQYALKNITLGKEVKLCPRCKREIPLLMFGKSAVSGDGRQSYCLDCMNGYAQERRSHEQA